jgi:hypothetical protein
MRQFNGKQEGMPGHGGPNLRCPRNGKRLNPSRDSAFITQATGRVEQAPGKAMKDAPPARIPANAGVARAMLDV